MVQNPLCRLVQTSFAWDVQIQALWIETVFVTELKYQNVGLDPEVTSSRSILSEE